MKRKALSLIDKLDIIRRVYEKKEKRVDIADHYQIWEATISVILANKEVIEAECKEKNNLNRKQVQQSFRKL